MSRNELETICEHQFQAMTESTPSEQQLVCRECKDYGNCPFGKYKPRYERELDKSYFERYGDI